MEAYITNVATGMGLVSSSGGNGSNTGLLLLCDGCTSHGNAVVSYPNWTLAHWGSDSGRGFLFVGERIGIVGFTNEGALAVSALLLIITFVGISSSSKVRSASMSLLRGGGGACAVTTVLGVFGAPHAISPGGSNWNL